MLTREEDIDVHALAKRGWTISAIARHLGRDRKTVRAYLSGERVPGQRTSPGSARFDPFVGYCRARLVEDPHVWATTLFDEIVELGYAGSHQTLTYQIRRRGLRPACEPCRPTKDRPVAVIEHPPGAETQWDWVELPNPLASWLAGSHAHLLVGALAHSGKWRGVLLDSEDQAHLVVGLDQVTRALGGLTRVWRFDSVGHGLPPRLGAGHEHVRRGRQALRRPGRDLPATARQPQGRGRERGVHVAAQRWWRNLPDDISVEAAQGRLDRWCATRGDARTRPTPAASTSTKTDYLTQTG